MMKSRRSFYLFLSLILALSLGLSACNLPPEALGRSAEGPQGAVETVVAATLAAEGKASPEASVYLPAVQSGQEGLGTPSAEAGAAATVVPTAIPTPEPTPVPTEVPAAYQSYALEDAGDAVTALAVDGLGIYFVSKDYPSEVSRLGFDGASFETIAELPEGERVVQGRLIANGLWLIYFEMDPDAAARAFGLHAVYLPTVQDFTLVAGFGGQTDPSSVAYALEGSNLLVTRCDFGADLTAHASCRADIFYLDSGGQAVLAQSDLSTGGAFSNPGLSGATAYWLEGAGTDGAQVRAVNIYSYAAEELDLAGAPGRLLASSGYLLYGADGDGAAVDFLVDLAEGGESELAWPEDVSARAQLGPSVAAGAGEAGEWRVLYSRAGDDPAAVPGSATPGKISRVDIADEWLAWASEDGSGPGQLHWMPLP